MLLAGPAGDRNFELVAASSQGFEEGETEMERERERSREACVCDFTVLKARLH